MQTLCEPPTATALLSWFTLLNWRVIGLVLNLGIRKPTMRKCVSKPGWFAWISEVHTGKPQLSNGIHKRGILRWRILGVTCASVLCVRRAFSQHLSPQLCVLRYVRHLPESLEQDILLLLSWQLTEFRCFAGLYRAVGNHCTFIRMFLIPSRDKIHVEVQRKRRLVFYGSSGGGNIKSQLFWRDFWEWLHILWWTFCTTIVDSPWFHNPPSCWQPCFTTSDLKRRKMRMSSWIVDDDVMLLSCRWPLDNFIDVQEVLSMSCIEYWRPLLLGDGLRFNSIQKDHSNAFSLTWFGSVLQLHRSKIVVFWPKRFTAWMLVWEEVFRLTLLMCAWGADL